MVVDLSDVPVVTKPLAVSAGSAIGVVAAASIAAVEASASGVASGLVASASDYCSSSLV